MVSFFNLLRLVFIDEIQPASLAALLMFTLSAIELYGELLLAGTLMTT